MFNLLQRFGKGDDDVFRRSLEKKRERITRSAEGSILLELSRIFFWITIGGTIAMAFGETGAWLKYGVYGADKYRQNLSFSAFYCWLGFGAVTVILSLFRLSTLRKRGSEPDSDGAAVMDENSGWRKHFKKRPETRQQYIDRCRICLAGTVILFVFYAVTHLVIL
ncbi:MAG: hypothetical protein LBL26_00810 [Peptococcaceae bacterium]|jgi:hypothetical protein|nr:hypothetical protein [Peptococcaceae bacterium]